VEAPRADLLGPVIEKLIAAKRPVIVAGRGARAANAKDEIVKPDDCVGALLATSLQGKGYFAGHRGTSASRAPLLRRHPNNC
jgi:acetolactate synthase-1/2/3 large subunit